jgi:hypothetical protein
MFWNEWQKQLEELKPDAAEWNGAPAFLLHLETLLNRRLRESQSRLDEAIGNLSAECAGELEYFELTHVEGYRALNCSVGAMGSVTVLIERLREVLHEYRQSRDKPPENVSADRQRRARLESLEATVNELIEPLDAAFTIAQNPPPTGVDLPTREAAELPKSNETSQQSDPVTPTQLGRADDALPSRESSPKSPPRINLPDLLGTLEQPKSVADYIQKKYGHVLNQEDNGRVDLPLLLSSTDDSSSTAEAAASEIEANRGASLSTAGEPIHSVADDAVRLPELKLSTFDSPTDEQEAKRPDEQSGSDQEPVASPDDTLLAIVVVPSERQDAFLWQSVRCGDLAGAYWWCQSKQAEGNPSGIEPWLIAAVQASLWRPEHDLALADDLSMIALEHTVPVDPPSQLLATAAALLPTLTQPAFDLRHWLDANFPLPKTRDLVSTIRGFVDSGCKVRVQDIGNRQPREQTERELQSVVEEANHWLQQAPSHTTCFPRANHVWKVMVSHGGPLHKLLEQVVHDRRREVQVVKHELNVWNRRESIVRRLHELDGKLHKTKRGPIQASPIEQIVSWTFDACQLAQRWCNDIQHLEGIGDEANWFDQQVDELVKSIRQVLPDCFQELDEQHGGDDATSAAADCLRWALEQLAELFAVPVSATAIPAAVDGDVVRHASFFPSIEPRGLRHALARRLWWLPEIELDDEGQPISDALPKLAAALEREDVRSRPLRDALGQWIEREDFRFAEGILQILEQSDNWEEAKGTVDDALATARMRLRLEKEKSERQVRHAIVDGVLSDAVRAEDEGRLLGIDVEQVLDFPAAQRELREVQARIEENYRQRLAEQQVFWGEHGDRLLENADDQEAAAIRAFVEQAMARRETRVVQECLARLQDAKSEGLAATVRWFQRDQPPSPQPVAEFLACYQQISTAAAELPSRKQGGFRRLIELATRDDVSPQRMEEAEAAMKAWWELKRRMIEKGDPRINSCIERVLTFAGLTSLGSKMEIEWVGDGRNWTHLRAAANNREPSPVPQFGSGRRQHYDLLCLWQEPEARTLIAILQEARLVLTPTLIFYFGRLTEQQRGNIGRIAHREGLSIVVLDDILFTFLATLHDERWPALLRVALPYSAVNPYTPGAAGNVPREMFFGRDHMIRALTDMSGSGSYVVYGGRQLGKSALLRRAQREFHHPERGHYAVYEDIRLVGNALEDKPADLVWTVIRDLLNQARFFDRATSAERPEQLIPNIRKQIERDSRLRLIVLLDEADSFLDQDSEQQFANVAGLKKLMDETDGRVKVVFAGLHNVQRFEGIPNQPFAQLGRPIQVGPLEPLPAKALVVKPLEAVGYRFVDDSLILKILSYTNYHPGLIQFYCKLLLDDLRKQRKPGPPYEIDDGAIRSIYARAETQQAIRERFQVTLVLDPRYEAIVWSMIEDLHDRAERLAVRYSSDELLQLSAFWWPAAFKELSKDSYRGLVDELCGLGVLSRADGGYCLRSPNLVHLVGEPQAIRGKLNELAEKPAPIVGLKADSHRQGLANDRQRRSPFTYSQARQLTAARFGVGLIFGSPALGLEDVAQAIAQLIPEHVDDATKAIAAIDLDGENSDAASDALREFLETNAKKERLIAYAKMRGDVDQIQRVVRNALQFCQRREKSERQWMRVLLVFDPLAAWTWCQLPQGVRSELESAASTVVQLLRWDRDAIQLHLRQHHERWDIESVCEQLFNTTGGWPVLLYDVFKRTGQQGDPREAAENLLRELQQGVRFAPAFLSSLGIHALPNAPAVNELFRQLKNESFNREWLAALLDEIDCRDLDADSLVEFLSKMQLTEYRDGALALSRQVTDFATLQ